MCRLLLILTASLLDVVVAHGGTSNYTVNGVDYAGYDPTYPSSQQDGQPWLIQRKWTSIDPIFSPNSTSLACNFPGTPAPSSIPILPGQNITAIYYFWLHTVGPMTVMMADCGASCETFNPAEGKWFKIAERGLLTGTVREGMWAQRDFTHWDGTPDLWTEMIPRGLRRGNYLIRHEIIALHIAHRPQFYPQCAHLSVGGEGQDVPGEEFLTSIPGMWNMTQPEINLDIYTDDIGNATTYEIPGPPVWTGQRTAGLDRLSYGFKGPK
ncbi:glycoside hydrolase family 61 protein-like protein [Cadophora sp. MPI-SDFR-AT-0126]|nr:glycoside hydrolase family 61 protein-like protein [Leotiomycetes sp. MPI-SDFR-AT-0126]